MRLMNRREIVRSAATPLVLLAACGLAFGITIPWLGLYADDWPFIYVNHIAGLHGVVDFISWVRPVAAWVFAAAAAMIGTHFWLYHLLLLLLRWVDSLLFWRVLRRVWPSQPRLALWAALLFAVFPAFKQQPLALEYIPHFLALGLLFGSLWLSLYLAQTPHLSHRRFVLLWSLAWLGSLQVFIIEYFAGLELLRAVLVAIVLLPSLPPTVAIRKSLRLWLPFLPGMAAFALWRVFLVGFPSYQPELVQDLRSTPFAALGVLARTILHDLWLAGVGTWLQPFIDLPVGSRALLIWAALSGASALAFAIYLMRFAPKNQHRNGFISPAWGYVGLGLYAMLIAGWPFWITHIPLWLSFPWDRTSLAFMVGASLLAAGILGLFESLLARWQVRLSAVPNLVLVGVLGASIGLHFQNANAYRKEWSLLTSFYWQMTWRAPGLQPGTAIVLDQSPFNFHVDKFLSPALNWTYAPESRTLDTPYAVLDFYKLWGKSLPPETSKEPLKTQYGTLTFNGDTHHLLVVVYAPPGCLRVLTLDSQTHLLISPELKQTLSLSNPEVIDPTPINPAHPAAFLGPEPVHGWCYSFEKADLALQQGDPNRTAALGDQALSTGLSPKQPSEYLVFVEAYALLGRWQDAQSLSQKVAQSGDFYQRAACATWDRLTQTTDAAKAQAVKAALSCR